jgi:hypothetical protein
MEQLETASDFRKGMLQVAAEETARAVTARAQLGLLAGLGLLSRDAGSLWQVPCCCSRPLRSGSWWRTAASNGSWPA